MRQNISARDSVERAGAKTNEIVTKAPFRLLAKFSNQKTIKQHDVHAFRAAQLQDLSGLNFLSRVLFAFKITLFDLKLFLSL